MRSTKIASLLAFAFMAFQPAASVAVANIITSFFAGSDYNSTTSAMNTTLGLSGYTIDDFESTTLLTGLSVVIGGGVPTTPETSLPALFEGDVFSSLTANDFWDGTATATNATGNAPNSTTDASNVANLTTFDYTPGTLSFGIGLSNFQSSSTTGGFAVTNHELFVNGVDIGTIETLAGANWTPGLSRNAYLVISDTVPITSVGIENLNQPPDQQDLLMFDHLAILPNASVPEPGTLALLGAAMTAMAKRVRRF